MTRSEMLLVQLMEESAEIGQEVSKCLRFGPDEVYAPIGVPNAERVMLEFMDVLAMVNMLQGSGVLPELDPEVVAAHIDAKTAKVEKYLEHARACGTLVEP